MDESIYKALNDLVRQTSETNTKFVEDATKFISNLSSGNIKPDELISVQQKLVSDAVNGFVKLNIQYASNLIGIWANLAKHLNDTADKSGTDNNINNEAPSFEIKLSTIPGKNATAEFLINNVKSNSVDCTFNYTDFISLNKEISYSIPIILTPSSFTLLSGKSLKVEISILVSKKIKPGIYCARVNIVGNTGDFFTILLEVTDAEKGTRSKSSAATKNKQTTKKSTKQKEKTKK